MEYDRIFIFVLHFSFCHFYFSNSKALNFELIHSDSPLSPFHNVNDSMTTRGSQFRHARSSIGSKVHRADGIYLMKLLIRSPPFQTFAVADTGSSLIWTQCLPCKDCYPQDGKLFDPSKSTTYANISCDQTSCNKCDSNHNCEYNYGYHDLSETTGVWARETFTFSTEYEAQDAKFNGLVFGCGHNNSGSFPRQSSGIVGLGRGHISLISQLSLKLDKKFSYCLLPKAQNYSSKLQIGGIANIPADKYVSTPLFSNSFSPTFYYLLLEGITVGGKKLVNKQSSPYEGNIVIDSGTTLTFLERELYNDLEAMVRRIVELKPVVDPLQEFLLCYDINSFKTFSNITMIFHFQGADIVLTEVNLFMEVGDMTCLSVKPNEDTSIYGNVAQINFQVEFDLQKEQVSFARTNCLLYLTAAETSAGGSGYCFQPTRGASKSNVVLALQRGRWTCVEDFET